MNSSKPTVRLGIDLGKNCFHLWGVDEDGNPVLKKTLRRGALLPMLANLPACRIGLEACAGAHHWARELTPLGHDVRLMAPQFVKPYVKGDKNDYNDAEAICEAVGRPNMRFVPVKSIEQQDGQALHRLRQGTLKERTALVNRLRGLLAEYGVVVPQGIGSLRRALPEILEDGENRLSADFRALLGELQEQFVALDARIAGYDARIARQYQSSAACQRIGQLEGIGPQTATAIVASLGDGSQFQDGRQLAAALGLVPRQHSTGGKPCLLGISKRGDRYVRTLLIHGARSAIQAVFKHDKDDARSRWIKQLVARRGHNVAAVALANKNARIVWALLTRQESYRTAA